MGSGITMPSFSSIVKATPLDSGFNPGLGYFVGSGIANQLLSASQSAISNQQQKKSIAGFADAVESTDPESAKIYRSLAESIPAFDPTSLNPSTPGSKAAGTSGGGRMSFSGATGEVMSNMLDMVKLRTQQAGQMALENQRTKNDAMLQRLRNTATMAEIVARKDAEIETTKLKGKYDLDVEQLRHQFDGPELALKATELALKFKKDTDALKQRQDETQQKREHDTSVEKNTDTRAKATVDAAQLRADAQKAGGSSSSVKAPSDSEVDAAILTDPHSRSERDRFRAVLANSNSTPENVAIAKTGLQKLEDDKKAAIMAARAGGASPQSVTRDSIHSLKPQTP